MLEQIIAGAKSLQPETALSVAFCALLVADLLFRKNKSVLPWLALMGLLAAGFFLASQAASGTTSILFNMFAVDSFSIYFKLVILVSSMIVVLFSVQSEHLNAGTRPLGEYYALLIALTLGMFLMTGASNLLMMYLSLELASISSYILAGYTKESEDSSEASLKYVIYGAASSGLMLYGISILYGLTGAVDIYGVNQALATGDVSVVALIIAGILILAGFGYKISAAPFHFWTPDVYEGAPITITAFLSVASKAAGFAMMIRFFKVSFLDPAIGNLGPGAWASFRRFGWGTILSAVSVLTMTLAHPVAVWQD